MIMIDQQKCSGCGLCAAVCHESCISLATGGLQIDHAVCSTCTQCIAICPQQALAWDQLPAQAFERKRLPAAEQLDELFKERRSIRRFKECKIERALLAEIAAYGAYAPTHNFNLRVIVVDDDALISSLDRLVLENCRLVHRLAFRNRLVFGLAGWLGYADELKKARPKIEAALSEGRVFHSRPAAVLFVVGNKKTPLSEASAQYALANMMYYAQVKGIGTCLWGNGPIFVDKHKGARRQLGLGRDERIFGALFMGYPAVKFSNKLDGREMPIQWL